MMGMSLYHQETATLKTRTAVQESKDPVFALAKH